MAAISGRRASASPKVALRAGSMPCERGKISYQAPKWPRSRSSQRGNSAGQICKSSRGSHLAIRSASNGSRISSTFLAVLWAAATACRVSMSDTLSLPWPALIEASMICSPSSSSLDTSCPASTFVFSSATKEPKRSVHATTVNTWGPTSCGLMIAYHRSLKAGSVSMTDSRQSTRFRSGAAGMVPKLSSSAANLRHRTAARSNSCPSFQMSAATSTLSPTTALAAKRPQSTLGVTFSITIRTCCIGFLYYKNGPRRRPKYEHFIARLTSSSFGGFLGR